MLGNILEKKFHRKRNRKSQQHNTSTASIKDKENAEDSHKITEYFHIRRSSRKTAKQIEDTNTRSMQHLIKTGANEKFLEVYKCKVKGRGIKSLKKFWKGEFVVEYRGEIINSKIAQLREEEYAKDEHIGSYMYYFKHQNTDYCVDATEESTYKGRLVNHSYLRPNLKTRVVDFGTSFHLILIAKRDIEAGEELLYDYGERRPDVVAGNPWLMNS